MSESLEPTLPPAFVERLKHVVSEDDWQATIDSFTRTKRVAFRVNLLRANIDNVLDELSIPLQSLPWYREGFVADIRQREYLVQSPAFTEGRIYIQNPASMLAPLALAAEPGEEVLDLAAAPGGKTLMLATMMRNQGRIAAVDSVKGRFFRLKNNLSTFGAVIVDTYLKDGRQVGYKVPERFDRVLLDAPCSSESRFDLSDPASFSHWNERKVKEVQRKQKKLICSGLAALKPGGVMVYSTCSYSPEENELVVQHALKKFAGAVSVEPIAMRLDNFRPGLVEWRGKTFDPAVQQSVRVLPTESMHGFFLCRLRKHSHC